MRRLGLALLLAAMPATAAAPLAAQVPAASAPDDSAPRTAPVSVLSAHDLIWAGGTAAATLVAAQLDRPARAFMLAHGQDDRTLKRASHVVEAIAVPGAFVIGGGLWAGGRLAHERRVADLGLHGTEAVLIGNLVVSTIKLGAGRARPYAGHGPHDFEPFRGIHDEEYRSFPSGHAVTAFAAAAAVTEEARRWDDGSVWYVAPLLYGGATAVGLSRMYNDKHWASDVVMGAAVGIFTGRRVVRWQHSHPGNRVDRWFLGVSLSPDPMGPGQVMRLLVIPLREGTIFR